MFALSNRMKNVWMEENIKDIDYEAVQDRIDEKRKKSIAFLKCELESFL